MKTLPLALLLIEAENRAVAQTPAVTTYDSTTHYSVPQRRADLAYVRRTLEEVHPALYWYTPRDSLNQVFARAEATITHPLSEPAFWRQLQTLVGQVHCGPTSVRHSAAYRAWFRRQPHSYLPFTVAVRQNWLFVTDNQSTAPALRPGTEVLAIDGHPTAELLAAYGFDEHELTLEPALDLPALSIEHTVPLGLILNELVTNAMKHAYASLARPWLRVQLSAPQPGSLLLEVEDNGPGIAPARWQAVEGTFGQQLILAMSAQLSGQVTTANQPGAFFSAARGWLASIFRG